MYSKKSLPVVAIAAFLFGFSCTLCQAQQPVNNSSQSTEAAPNDYNDLDFKIEKWQKELNIPNVGLVVIDKDKLVKAHVYGNARNGQPAPKAMLFEVASVTKVVFATLVLKLVQDGKWNLDEPLCNYYIDSEVASNVYSKKLTTRHVLSQQSGFDNWRWMNASGKLTFNFEPGTKFNYSGEGFEYLRLAIEHRFHKSLAKLSDSLLFRPLHMNSTSHEWDGKKDFALYSGMYDAEGKEIVKNDYSVQSSAAAGLTTTVNDMSKFAIEVLNGAHLSGKLYKEMVSKQAYINPNINQGLGWRVINGLPNYEYALQHAGNDPGVASIIVLLPKSKRGVVVMTNADNGLIMCNNIVRAAFPEGSQIIYKAYKSAPISEEPKRMSLATEVLMSRTGNFKRADGAMVTVTLKGSQLVLRMSGIPDLYLVPESEDKFYLLDLDAKVFFTKDQNGKITSVSIQDGGNVIKCDKVGN
ncbi:serine hydrolase [Mucilaginibacter kameinonensis]|uniref:serine hydrolase n=1 Tax=Mucilaginibacter kameinonensis TaxID=452286 RepID=UPI000EF806CC|nr:serine hydrolase [Mucilaginibacter kameinonensis]